ncbi:hypothetical protein SESBI_49548 [Sesbania bispinosa]|nr:hypothetical protein SESBI_49548 [Sesbania bispinosa]
MGGWGFKDLHSFNRAMIMKLNWGLIHNLEALWVRVLRHKYGCGSGYIPLIMQRSNVSNVWRGIMSTWAEFTESLRFNLGNGQTTSFWHSRCLPSNLVIGDEQASETDVHVLRDCSFAVKVGLAFSVSTLISGQAQVLRCGLRRI